jgi:hypothetical protein
MRTTRYLAPLIASAGALAALALAPTASAEPNPTLPNCTSAESAPDVGTSTTECQSPGNVQINATAPDPVYAYPWDDEYYGSALIIGPGENGPRGGGGGAGGGGGGHR